MTTKTEKQIKDFKANESIVVKGAALESEWDKTNRQTVIRHSEGQNKRV